MKTNKSIKVSKVALVIILVVAIVGFVLEINESLTNGTAMQNGPQFTMLFSVLTIAFSSIEKKEKEEKKAALDA